MNSASKAKMVLAKPQHKREPALSAIAAMREPRRFSTALFSLLKTPLVRATLQAERERLAFQRLSLRRLGFGLFTLLGLMACGLSPFSAGADRISKPPLLTGGLEQPESGWTLGPNLLVNGDFSQGLNGWSGMIPQCFKLDPGTKSPNGSASAMVDKSQSCTVSYPRLVNRATLEPGSYDVSAYIKTQDMTGDPGTGAHFYFSAGAGWYYPPGLLGSNDWTLQKMDNLVIMPHNLGSFRFGINGASAGRAWFANASVRAKVPPPLQVFLLYPNYRGIMFDDLSQTIEVQLHLSRARLPDASKVIPQIVLRDQSGTIITRQAYESASSDFVATLDASKLQLGTYELIGSLVNASGATVFSQSPYRIVKLPAKVRLEMKAWVDPQNRTHFIDGQPHFVLGIYDTGGYGATPGWFDQGAAAIAKAPLNMYINYFLGAAPVSSIRYLAQSLLEYGMVFLPSVNNYYQNEAGYPESQICANKGQDALIACYTKALSSERGVAGYYVQDEPDVSLQPQTFHQYALIKQNDPGSVTFGVLNSTDYASFWRDTVDVMGTDPYPLYYDEASGRDDLAQVADATRTVVRAVYGARPVWTVIQFFQFTSAAAWPTEEQLRDMSWMAIVAGASGLFYWSHGAKGLAWAKDVGWKPTTHFYHNQLIRDSNGNVERATAGPGGGSTGSNEPHWPTVFGAQTRDGSITWALVASHRSIKDFLYDELIAVTKSIKALEPALLSPDSVVLDPQLPTSPVVTRQKSYRSTRYVIAYNHGKTPVTAHFALLAPASSVAVHDEHRTIAVNGKSFTDLFQPYASHVYVIK